MISRPVWTRWWGVLCERYGRTPSPDLAAIYLAGCAAQLNDATFPAAVAQVVARLSFFPTVAEIVGAVQVEAPAALRAADAFATLLTLGEYTPYGATWSEATIQDRLGGAAVVAFRAIGGQGRLRHLTEDQEHWALDKFVKAYVEADDYVTTVGQLQAALPPGARPVNRLARPQRIGTLLPVNPTPGDTSTTT